jgi:hypothetical protein
MKFLFLAHIRSFHGNVFLVSVCQIYIYIFFFLLMAIPAHSGSRPLIQFRNLFYTDGGTPWTSDQPVARPLPTHRTTQHKRVHTPNIHAPNGIRTPRSQRPRERKQFTPCLTNIGLSVTLHEVQIEYIYNFSKVVYGIKMTRHKIWS